MTGHYDKYLLLEKNSNDLFEFDEFFSTFIHLKYYSLLQYLHYLLINEGHYKDYKELFNSRSKGSGLHNYIIKDFTNKFVNPDKLIDLVDSQQQFEYDFKKLKDYRTIADYSENTMVGYSESDKVKIKRLFNDFSKRVKKYE